MAAYRRLIIGNWKMHGLSETLDEAVAVGRGLGAAPEARVAICPPATLIERMARALKGLPLEIGGQDCAPEVSGAYTGDISAQMLSDAGARLVILGHSERRTLHGEASEAVAVKALAAVEAGLGPIICVGETVAQRQAGQAESVITGQIAASVPQALAGRPVVLAYEPVWAIGTGLTPSPEEIVQAHGWARAALIAVLGASGQGVPILYGGSVKPANAAKILGLSGVDGVLVGGASLKAADFLAIIRAA